MTDDDYIRTANYMEEKSHEEMGKPHGGFMSNYWRAIHHLAKAYYHADTSNQRIMRKSFGAVFEEFNAARQEAA